MDTLTDLPGERNLVEIGDSASVPPGMAVADAFAPAWSPLAKPVQIQLTNYRLKLYEPTATGATLHVTVCSGQGLKQCDMNGKADPYALLSLTGCFHRSMVNPKRTSVKYHCLDPIWNEDFVFESVSEAAGLKVELFDKDRITKDDYMGEVHIPLVALRQSGAQQRQWTVVLPIEEDGKLGHGTLRLRLRVRWPLREGEAVRHCSIPLFCIEDATLHHETEIEIATKTVESLSLRFDEPATAGSVFKAMSHSLQCVEDAYCFQPVPHEPKSTAGCSRFSWDDELQRLTSQPEAPPGYSKRWRVDKEINKSYRLCPTYSEVVALPTELTLDEARASATFRTKKRFPCVSWVHPNNGAMLVRCSQPQTSLGIGKSSAASADCNCLMRFAPQGTRELTICDARPFTNAQANALRSGGTEYNATYKDCRVEFLNIDNIHEMRKSLTNLRAGTCQQTSHSKCSEAVTSWLSHVHAVIKGANLAATSVDSGQSVVVHCSDGWDRTSQIVSLASLLLDGHYRTIAGISKLVEKDWLLPGHKFEARNGLAGKKWQQEHHNELSPIFLQFLDCVAQIWSIYPKHFEYTPRLLSFILYHSYSGRYGNFFGDCEQRRAELRSRELGTCLWAEVKKRRGAWTNPLYCDTLIAEPIVPCIVPLRRLAFSEELYSGFAGLWMSDDRLSRFPEDNTPVPDLDDFTPSEYMRRMASHRPCLHSTTASVVDSFIFCCGWRGTTSSSISFLQAEAEERAAAPVRATAVEMLLRGFLDLNGDFPASPTVTIVSHSRHRNDLEFVIKIAFGNNLPEGSSVVGPTNDQRCVLRNQAQFEALARALRTAARLVLEEPLRHRITCKSVVAAALGWCVPHFRAELAEMQRHQLNSWLQSVLQAASMLRD